jgi:hypothetical protein
MVLAGGTLLVAPFLATRLLELSLGAHGVSLKLTQEIVELGAPKTARKLEREGLTEFAYAYALIHEQSGFADKTWLQDALVTRAQGVALRERLDPTEVRELFFEGSPVLRVMCLGLMKGDPSLADENVVRSAIAESRTGNEQYHGLKLAELLWPRLTPEARQRLKTTIEDAPYWRQDEDRRSVGDALLRRSLKNRKPRQ